MLAREMKKNGNTVWGIEIDPEQAEKARDVCEKVLVGNIENVEFDIPEKIFDVIVFADVLEHLRKPEDVLLKMRRLLKDDGFMVISLPNIAHISMRKNLFFGSFDYGELGILDRTHLRFFTLKTAQELIRGCGFKILTTDITIPRIPRINSTNERYSPLFKAYYALSNSWRTGLAFQFIFKISK